MPENHDKAYEIFKETREQRGLSISDITNALHLNVAVIEQIEAGDFSNRRFAPVFMRGYIRSYAKYLNLPDDVTDHIVRSFDLSSQPTPVSAHKLQAVSSKRPSALRIKKIIAYIAVVIALILIASFWHSARQAPLPTTESAPVSTASTETTTAPSNPPIEDAPSTTPDSNAALPPEDESAALPQNLTPLPEEEAPVAIEPPLSETTPVAPTEPENPPVIATPAPVVKAPTKTVAAPPTNPTSTSPEVVDAQETP